MSSDLSRTLQKIVFIIVVIISIFIILTYLFSMGLGILVVFSTLEGLEFSLQPYSLYPFLIIDWEVTVNSGLYYLSLWLIFAFCFVAAWKYRESLSIKVREVFSKTSLQSLFHNNLLAMPLITSMLLVGTVVLHHIQTSWGIPTGSPSPGDPFLDFLRVSRAPLVEEAVFRIIPIGAFLIPYIFLVGLRTKPEFSWPERLKICVLSILQPDKAKEKIGLKSVNNQGLRQGIIWAEWLMIALTASLFGVAHYFGGWGPGKISQTTMSGAAFALAYLYYGAQAPILLHWFFNYYFTVFDLSFTHYYAGIDFLSISWLANIFLGMLLWIVAIILLLYLTASAILKRVKRKAGKEPIISSSSP